MKEPFDFLYNYGISQEDALTETKAAIANGVINAARFEKYMQKVSGAGRLLVGKKNLYRLFEYNTTAEQQVVFDSGNRTNLCNRYLLCPELREFYADGNPIEIIVNWLRILKAYQSMSDF